MRNSLPDLLKHLQEKLRYLSNDTIVQKVEAVAREHAEQRVLLTNYSLSNVLTEYHLLLRIILEVLREEGPLAAQEDNTIHDVIDRGIAHAGQHYMELSEAKLRESEERFRLLVEGTTEYAIYMLSPEGIVQTWNTGAERIKGYEAQEVIGRHFSLFYPEEAIMRGHPQEELRIAAKEGRYEEEGLRLKKDGTQFWANVVITALFERDGSVRGYSHVTRDITERKRTEQATQESEQRFRTLANSIPQLAWTANPDGWIHWYNDRWYEYTGTTPQQMEGWGWQSVHDPQELPRVLELWKHSISTGTPFDMTFPLKGADGKFRWFLTRVVPIRGSDGTITGWFGTNTDIQFQREAEERITALHQHAEASRRELHDFFMQAPAPLVILLGHDHRFQLANPPYERLVRRKVTGKTVLEAFTPEEVSHFMPPLERVYKTGEPHVGVELPLHIPDDSGKIQNLFANVGYHPLRNPDGSIKGVLVVAQDVTEQVMARKKVELLAADLQSAVQTRDEFLSIASHELKTPLTSLKLQVQMRVKNLSKGNIAAFTPERIKKMNLDDMRQIERVTRLIDDMLDISRISTGKLTIDLGRFDLCVLADEVVERYREQIEANRCQVSLTCCDPVEGQWDRFRIEQVIVNLLTNAMKYGAGKPIEICVSSHGDRARLTVRDRGLGIAKENHERIFQRFERAVSATGISGMGLGLYITRKIVEMHGGSIRVESELGEGSTFIMDLPHEDA